MGSTQLIMVLNFAILKCSKIDLLSKYYFENLGVIKSLIILLCCLTFVVEYS